MYLSIYLSIYLSMLVSSYLHMTQGKRDGTGRLWEKHNSNSTPSCNVSSSNVSTPLDVRLVDSNYLLQLINEEDAGTLDLDSYLEMYRFLRERITINVSGQVYEIWKDTLEQHPDTLLGNPQKRAKYFDRGRQEYFFDRHRPSFDAIFFYYQSGGKLRRPDSIPDDIFLSEIEFFELEKDQIANYKKCEGYVEEKIVLPERPCQRKLWILLEYPESSVVAYVIGIVSVFLTLTSIVLFCIETLPHFSKNDCGENEDETYPDMFFFTETVCTICAIYFAETELPDSQIQSIPDGFWWALITMTTVGYGDRVPVGFLGKVIGSMCAVAGVLTLAIPVPIITENFNKFYAHRARNAGIPDTE
ncbi:KCNA1 [Acanthosepion pharaonis]|uniref:KCNA1 n=1 Tax=Acanthosepion pharaonis TaxID=158019 RepID=A0A812EPU9_ACAPH|nr:KCNA1 [Sepia pharaonis]